jgi:hypothetical protein
MYWQAFAARLTAGDPMSIDFGIAKIKPLFGMQAAAASWDPAKLEGLEGLVLVLLDLLAEPPQPAITSRPDTTTTAIGSR